MYDVEARQFPTWSRDLVANLPKRLTLAHDPILGVLFDPSAASTPSKSKSKHGPGRYVILWGSTWLCKIKLDGSVISGSGSGKKRRREGEKSAALQPIPFSKLDEEQQDFKMITHYRPILYVDFLAAGELVVVERPLVDVLATLPPAYFKHKYGAS